MRKLAKDLGVDLTTVGGSGPGGIITREDVVAQQARTEAQPLATYPGDEEPWLAGGTVSVDDYPSAAEADEDEYDEDDDLEDDAAATARPAAGRR